LNSFFIKRFTLLILLASSLSVSAQEEGWLKKKWHNMNARYNGYFYASELLDKADEKLKEVHKDDFNTILSVYPYGNKEESKELNADMDDAYKKASKVIRKHDESKWVDECYLLIARSHFMKNDEFSALEGYQYLISQYPNSQTSKKAKVGILLTYLANDKVADAEAIWNLFTEETVFEGHLLKHIHAIHADIYIRQGKHQQAAEELENALKRTKNKYERYRYNFILGQLNLKIGEHTKARKHFVKTIRLTPPYQFAFQANLGLISTIAANDKEGLRVPKKYLKKMLKDDKNIDYQDQIYFELAKIAMLEGLTTEAIKYYQLSARKSVSNSDQKASSYLALAKLFFGRKEYTAAQNYFDSTVTFISELHPEYEKINAQHLVLTDLIENLVLIETQDSLLKLSELSKEQLDKKIDAILKTKQEEAERKKLEEELNDLGSLDPNQNKPLVQGGPSSGEWYFYNTTAIARGKNDFQRKWGRRGRTDYWRFADRANNNIAEPEDVPDDTSEDISYDQKGDKEKQEYIKSVPLDKRKYYEDIPISERAKQIAHFKIAKGLFNAGKIYQEHLKDFELAKSFYFRLLERYPKTKYQAETYFLLHKCSMDQGLPEEAKKYSEILRKQFPESPYNKVLNNKDINQSLGEKKEVIVLYEKMYAAFKKGEYSKAKDFKNEATKKYPGNSIQAKYDFLYAMIIGKTESQENYVSALLDIKTNYPGTKIGNRASYILNLFASRNQKEQNTKEGVTEENDYIYEPVAAHFFISIFDGGSPNKVQQNIANYNGKYHSLENLKVTNYLLGNKNIVAVVSFKDKETAEKYYIEFLKNSKLFKDAGVNAFDNYYISKNNFKTLLKDTNADSYSHFFLKNYIQ
jgi:tetratricopeptide (TPR) repeat protein